MAVCCKKLKIKFLNICNAQHSVRGRSRFASYSERTLNGVNLLVLRILEQFLAVTSASKLSQT